VSKFILVVLIIYSFLSISGLFGGCDCCLLVYIAGRRGFDLYDLVLIFPSRLYLDKLSGSNLIGLDC
jgi:hypothetical protein